MKNLAAPALCLLLLILSSAAFADAKLVNVGDVPIKLPQVQGFRELYGQNPDFDKMAQQFVPQGNQLLAVYVSEDDIAAMQQNPQSGLKKYILVQTEGTPVVINEAADFNAVKEDFANQIGAGNWQDDQTVLDTAQSVSAYMRNQLNSPAELKIGDTKFLGKLIDRGDALGVAILANYGVTTQQGTMSYPIAAGLSVLTLKSRVLYVFVYSDYSGAGDVDFVTSAVRGFVDTAVSINKQPVARPAPESPSPMPQPQPQAKVPAVSQTEPSPAPSEQESAPEPERETDFGGAMAWATKAAVLVLVIAGAALYLPRLIKQLRRKDDVA